MHYETGESMVLFVLSPDEANDFCASKYLNCTNSVRCYAAIYMNHGHLILTHGLENWVSLSIPFVAFFLDKSCYFLYTWYLWNDFLLEIWREIMRRKNIKTDFCSRHIMMSATDICVSFFRRRIKCRECRFSLKFCLQTEKLAPNVCHQSLVVSLH